MAVLADTDDSRTWHRRDSVSDHRADGVKSVFRRLIDCTDDYYRKTGLMGRQNHPL